MAKAGCGVVKCLGHYSSAQTILVVGDGDMSFSRALATAFGSGDNLVATSLDTYEALTSKYGQAKSNVTELKRLGAIVLHCVDAGTMKHHRCLKMRRFDRIVFNFPHAGFIGQENDDHMIEAHQLLVRSFFHNASHLLCPDGEIHVSHKMGQPYDRWKIEELAYEFSLVMFDTVAFRKEHYPGYNQKRGDSDRCNEEFSLHNGYTFKFRVEHEEVEECAQKDAFSIAAQRESLHRLQESPSHFLALVSSRPKSPIHLRSMAAAEGEKKMLTLKSSDGDEFEVEEAVAMESQTIHHMIEDDCADNGIPLPNVNSKIISKVPAYCNKHIHATAKPADGTTTDINSAAAPAAPVKDLKNWDVEFVKVDQATLFDLILAANYLSIKGLLDLTCQTVVGMIKGRTLEEMLKTFNIKNDFTPEEEEEIRRENQWAFE